MSLLKFSKFIAVLAAALLVGTTSAVAVSCSNPICTTTGWGLDVTNTDPVNAHCYRIVFSSGPFSCNDNNGNCQTTFCVAANSTSTFFKNWPGGGSCPGCDTVADIIVVTNCDDANDQCIIYDPCNLGLC